ncbi:MAG TPA: metalloregulator ArsR/SmtB family transcription factor [Chloroflexota bacterium]|nr:metalloregulator ArsR/SmtB family transcription factor [Chloroflexota bacterium]
MPESFIAIHRSLEATEIRSRFFRALGDPKRLKILELLLDGEKSVGEIVDHLQASQGRVSNHLACLRWCGFVTTRRAGKFVYYQLADLRIREIVRLADAVIGDNASAIASCTRIAADTEM